MSAAPEQDAQAPHEDAEPHVGMSRGELVRKLIVFQIKLALDGLRDVLLSPVSIGVVLFGLIKGGRQPDALFRQLLTLGLRSDRWIDLFDAHGSQPEGFESGSPQTANASTVIDAMERLLREEFAGAGGTDAVDAGIRSVRAAISNSGGGSNQPHVGRDVDVNESGSTPQAPHSPGAGDPAAGGRKPQ